MVPVNNSEPDLLQYLFSNYSADVRPVVNNGDPLTVRLGLMLKQIIQVVSMYNCTTCSYFVYVLNLYNLNAFKMYLKVYTSLVVFIFHIENLLNVLIYIAQNVLIWIFLCGVISVQTGEILLPVSK